MRFGMLLGIVAGCGVDGAGTGGGAVADTTPGITLLDPAPDAQRYGRAVEASFEVRNFFLDPAGIDGASDVEGRGHVHAYVDGVLVGETAETAYTFGELGTGGHTLEVRLADNSHDENWEGAWAWVETLDAAITIASPADGTQFAASSVPLMLATSGFEVSPDVAFGEVAFGQGRYEVRVDGAVVDFGIDPTAAVVSPLPEGVHEVAVALVTADGVPIDPPVQDSVSIEVLPASPYVAFDRSPYLQEHASATVPLAMTAVNLPLDYHLYMDGEFVTSGTEPERTLAHVGPGYHYLELRLTDGGSELPINDHLHLFVSDTRPDISITHPGDGWGVAASFELSVLPDHFTLDPANMGGTNSPGSGHWAVSVDDVVFAESATGTVGISGLLAGDRRIRVELENNDHTPLDPPVWTEITVSVE